VVKEMANEERKPVIKLYIDRRSGDTLCRDDTREMIMGRYECHAIGEPRPFLVKSSETIDEVVQRFSREFPFCIPGSSNAYCASDFEARLNPQEVRSRDREGVETFFSLYAVQFYYIEKK